MRNKKTLLQTIGICMIIMFLTLTEQTSAQGIVGVSPATYNYENVLRGGFAERTFTITYSSEEPAKVTIEKTGIISDWITLSTNTSEVTKTNPLRLITSVEPPEDIPNGNYTGTLRINAETKEKRLTEGHATGNIIAALDVTITVEVTDQEIVQCVAGKFKAISAEKGEDITFQLEVKNFGNIRLSPRVIIDLWNQDQTTIVKTKEFTGIEVLPTRTKNYDFLIDTTDLEVDQYWAEINAIQCLATDLLTVDVYEPGTLRAQGILKELIVQPIAQEGETIPILAIFENTGEKNVDARFKGQITQEGKIIQLLESEPTTVGVQEKTNFTFFYTPKKTGRQLISGRVFYDKKRTFEVSRKIEIIKEENKWKKTLLSLIYAAIIIIIAYLYFKIRKERRRHYKR